MHYWECEKLDDEGVSVGECFDDQFGLLFPDPVNPVFTLDSGILEPGQYRFKAAVMKEPLFGPEGRIEGRMVTQERTITVLSAAETIMSSGRRLQSAEDIPTVGITPLDSEIVNTNERLALKGNIYNDNADTIYAWSVLEGTLDIEDYPKTLGSPKTNRNLVIRKNVLSPGQKYTLQLTATNTATGLSGFDEITFFVNGPPTSGSCDISPKIGFAAETDFAMVCQGWEDDGTEPVEYEFRYYDPVTDNLVPLVARSRTNKIESIVPPVTIPENSYEIVVAAYIIDYFNAKTQFNVTIAVYPPKYEDLVMEMDNSTCAAETGDAEGCTYTLTGGAAFTENLIADDLRTATGTNNVPLMLTIAKSVMKINHFENERIESRPKPFIPEGAPVGDEEAARRRREAINNDALVRQTQNVMAALQDAVDSTQLTKEELDAFGNTYRESTQMASSSTPESSAAATDGLLGVLDSSVGTGIEDQAAQDLLDAAGSLAEAVDSEEVTVAHQARRALLDVAEAAAADQASEEVKKKSEAVFTMVEKLAQAGLKGAVEGEDPFSVASANLQVAAKRSTEVAGSFSAPSAPGVNASETPAFGIPAGAAGDGKAELDISSTVNKKNPFKTTGGGAGAAAANIQGQVASFEIKPAGTAAPLNVSLAEGQDPITIKIPLSLSGSSCRKTSGSCRFWDKEKGEWSTDGLFERERTDEYITCESLHLSSFAVSADDVVPEFNMVDPIGDADLFTNINASNVAAIAIIGFLYAGFALTNYFGYRYDIKQAKVKKLQEKIASIDSVLAKSDPKKPAAPEAALGAGPAGRGKNKKREKYVKAIYDSFTKDHLLARAFFVDPKDPFTRPQRTTIVLAVIVGQIAITAVFFGLDPSNIALKAAIGVITAVLLAPAKYFLAVMFQKSTYVPPKVKPAKKLSSSRRKKASGPPIAYKILVRTSTIFGAGTDSQVSIEIFGKRGVSGLLDLKPKDALTEDDLPVKDPFENGQTDCFHVAIPDLGPLRKIRIGIDGKGWGAGWHLDSVTVLEVAAERSFTFRCGKWLDKRKDGGFLSRLLDVNKEDLVETPTKAEQEPEAVTRPVTPVLPPDPLQTALKAVPPPLAPPPLAPPPPSSGVPRPRRKGSRATSRATSGAATPTGLPPGFKPPPPLPVAGEVARPRRRRGGGAAAAYTPSLQRRRAGASWRRRRASPARAGAHRRLGGGPGGK